jgi:hypothetical protein
MGVILAYFMKFLEIHVVVIYGTESIVRLFTDFLRLIVANPVPFYDRIGALSFQDS